MLSGSPPIPTIPDRSCQRDPQPIHFAVVMAAFFCLVTAAFLSGCSAASPSQITFSDQDHWQASLTLLQTSQDATFDPQALLDSLRAAEAHPRLSDPVAVPGGAARTLELRGEGGADQVRRLVFGPLGQTLNPIGGPTAITFQGAVHSGEKITFTLETHSASGYMWMMDGSEAGWLAPDGEASVQPRGGRLGGDAPQVQEYTALHDGVATIRWVYRRPWEKEDPAAERALQITAPELGQISDLSNPLAPDSFVTLPPSQDVPVQSLQTQSVPSVPASFDWRSHAALTPVRDQGGCGSCWAFATVGVLESDIAITDHTQVDLSEQYLVSCNTFGWGCGGGFTAHDFHDNLPGKNNNAPGAVLESSFPYAAKDAACGGPYAHPYQIQSWSYVGGTWNPTAAQIKQAIYTYGPVETTVCVGKGWYTYSGGVYSRDDKAWCLGSLVNHAVDLVGWDDAYLDPQNVSHKVWVVRNSWGAGWGQNGYMLIDQGISNLGYATSYAVYQPIDPSDTSNFTTGTPSLFIPLIMN